MAQSRKMAALLGATSDPCDPHVALSRSSVTLPSDGVLRHQIYFKFAANQRLKSKNLSDMIVISSLDAHEPHDPDGGVMDMQHGTAFGLEVGGQGSSTSERTLNR